MMQKNWEKAIEEARRYLKEAGPEPTRYVKQAHVFICWSRSYLPEDSPPEGGADTKKVRIGEEGVVRPEILWKKDPTVSPGIRGTALIEALIDEEGCVQSVRMLKKLTPELAEPAMAAVRQWVFSPTTLDGKPVKVGYVVKIDFL